MTIRILLLLLCLPFSLAAATFDEAFQEARILEKAGKLAEAQVSAQTAARLSPNRWEAPALLAIIHHRAGHTKEAQTSLTLARRLVPAESRDKLEKFAASLSVAAPVAPAALSSGDKLELRTLDQLMRDAAAEPTAPQIRSALLAVLKRSDALLPKLADNLPLWRLRAQISLSLGHVNAGWEAGRNLKRLGALDSTDDTLVALVTKLNSRGWLGATSPFEGRPVMLSDPDLELRPISAGTFTMGSPFSEPGRDNNEHQFQVTLTKPFWLGKTEVTVAQWRTVMGTSLQDQVRRALNDDTLRNYGRGKQETYRDFIGMARDDNPEDLLAAMDEEGPMIFVSWNDAMDFCGRLTDREREAGRLPEGYGYTLPTEAQWEYACRAGTTGAVYAEGFAVLGKHNAPALDAIAWYGGNSSVGYSGKGWDTANWAEKQYPGGTASYRKVGQKRANAWGLHDMIGNVWEWCTDRYGNYPIGSVSDPIGSSLGSNRVLRGGGSRNEAARCRSACRDGYTPDGRRNGIGFRLALSSVP